MIHQVKAELPSLTHLHMFILVAKGAAIGNRKIFSNVIMTASICYRSNQRHVCKKFISFLSVVEGMVQYTVGFSGTKSPSTLP